MAAIAQTSFKLCFQPKTIQKRGNRSTAVDVVAQKSASGRSLTSMHAASGSFSELLSASGPFSKVLSASHKGSAGRHSSRRNKTVFAAQTVGTTVPPVQVASADHPLIQKANTYLHSQSGFYSAPDEDVYSDEFVFRGPIIGPLNKKDYLKTMNVFKIWEALPDISPNAFGWSVDPKDPNRVWCMVRNTGTFTGEPGLGLGNGTFFPPNGAKLEGCPETFSFTFDEDQKVKGITVGYVVDRFEGNTNGAGAAVGILNVIGVPFPAPGPLLKFVQWFNTEVYRGGPSSYSTDNVPSWWKSDLKGSEGYR